MAEGPGKYDAACVAAMQATGGTTVVIAVLNGNHGSGFSVNSISRSETAKLPALLRSIADQIEGNPEVHPVMCPFRACMPTAECGFCRGTDCIADRGKCDNPGRCEHDLAARHGVTVAAGGAR